MARPSKDPDAVQLKRVQMDLAPKSLARLQSLQKRTEAASYGEVVRNALLTQEALIDLLGAGGRLLVERDGKTVEVVLAGIERD